MSRTCNCSRMTELAIAKPQLVKDPCDPCVANHHLLRQSALEIIMNRRFIQPHRVRELGWGCGWVSVSYQAGRVPCPLVSCPSVCLVGYSKQEEKLQGKELENAGGKALPPRGGLHLGPLFGWEGALGKQPNGRSSVELKDTPCGPAMWSRRGCHQTPKGSCYFDTTSGENNSKQHHQLCQPLFA